MCIRDRKGGQGLLLARIDDKAPFDGYTDPEKNRKVVLSDVFEKGDRYFNTGDLLRSIGFGHAQFVDRLGDTYRWKGENVSTTEVENIFMQYPQITEAVPTVWKSPIPTAAPGWPRLPRPSPWQPWICGRCCSSP